MYNRYVPQSDGSYQRNHVSERPKAAYQSPPQERPKAAYQAPPPQQQKQPEHPSCGPTHRPEPVGGFLKQLLPRSFDTADLIIVLLLLLLSGDSEEDRSTALLTLVLYLFM